MISDVVAQQILSKDKTLLDKIDSLRVNKKFPKIFLGTPDLTSYRDSKLAEIVPYIRITVVPDDEAIYADNARLMEFPTVQIDFWTKKEDVKSYMELTDIIYNAMQQQGWERQYFNAYVDGDVPTLRMVTTKYKYIG